MGKILGLLFVTVVGHLASAQTQFTPPDWLNILDTHWYKISIGDSSAAYKCYFRFYKDQPRNQLNMVQSSDVCANYISLDGALETFQCDNNTCTSEMKADDLKGLLGRHLKVSEYRKVTLTLIPNSTDIVLNIYLKARTGQNIGSESEVTQRFRLTPSSKI